MATSSPVTPQKLELAPRRGQFFDISKIVSQVPAPLTGDEARILEGLDLAYRTLCGILYNFVPMSGHPGGSISSGRIVEGLLYFIMDYKISDPAALEADILSYAAGHKAMGLYAMWALRNELVRIARPDLLPNEDRQLRLEDLVGFRRNPTQATPLFKKFHAKPLDGHPTPATPFVKLATGASGVGVPASLGLAFAALDIFHKDVPFVHILEGEGGMTPGRVHEAMAAAGSACLKNAVLHVDWNQASIDSNHVCRDGDEPGEYVQWNPVELAIMHDWNAIYVPEGFDFKQILQAQKLAVSLDNGQPTAVIYRTVKGWKYGIEGRASHGAGHKFCSNAFYQFLSEFEQHFNVQFPRYSGEATPEEVERGFWATLETVRKTLEQHRDIAQYAAAKIFDAQNRLAARGRKLRADAPQLHKLYDEKSAPAVGDGTQPLEFVPGESITLRATLGKSLNALNKLTGGAIIGSAADLLGSTSVSELAKGFPEGLYNNVSNPHARLIAVGGICEDAMGAFMAGVSTYGHHIGVTSSYGAFIGALEHVAGRLHGIGQQAWASVSGEPYKTWIMINAHAGVKTGEDGPTHADPQVLQLLQENFPDNVIITLTPWDPQEIWPLLLAGLKARPAILAPFVTRPPEKIVDRAALGLPPVEEAVKGIYAFRRADLDRKEYHGTVVLQGNGCASEFVNYVLPKVDEAGLNLNVFYITSVELFNRLPEDERERIFPTELTAEAMGITDFTLPTMYRWVRSNEGLKRTLHSFKEGAYLGSGKAEMVLQEAGIDGKAQLAAIFDYAETVSKKAVKVRPEVQREMPKDHHPPVAVKKVDLVCESCGTVVDPVQHFAGQPLPEDAQCLECDFRSRENCSYCQAYWIKNNPAFHFYCNTCENN